MKLIASHRTILLLLALLIAPLAANAQDTVGQQNPQPASTPPSENEYVPPPPENDDILHLDKLVVVGSVTPRSKFETPLAITTIDPLQLQMSAPRSTADGLKLVPGFYVESSGGEANNNLFARGAPTGGGYLYVMLHEDGLPVISESEMSFASTDNYTRITNWTASIEALRGGSASVFQSSAPIGIVNFVSREGATDLHGEVLFEAGDYGLLRNEFWLAGPAGKDTTFAIGGFYRIDDGIRSPGYVANKGGQVAANIRRTLPNGKGYFKISGKFLDDRTAFQLPIPLANPRNPKTIPGGPNINTGPSASPDIRYFTFSDTPMGALSWDLADGIQVKLGYIGTEFEYKLADNIKLQNRNRYTNVNKSWNANPPGVPASLQEIANALATSDNAAGRFAAALDDATNNYRFQLSRPGQGGAIVASNAAEAATLNGNGLGMDNNYWYSGATMRNFQNDMRLVFSLNNEATEISLGYYYAYLQNNRLWQWNRYLTDVTPDYHRLDVTYLDAAGAPIGSATYGGISQIGTNYSHGSGESTDNSLYANITHKIGSLALDAGIRHERFSAKASMEGTATYDLNAPGADNLALQNAMFGNGIYSHADYSRSETAWTLGANYAFTRRIALFARYSDGYRMPTIDAAMDAASNGDPAKTASIVGPTTKIRQYEVGLKYSRSRAAFFLTAFANRITNQTFKDYIVVDGVVTNPVTRIDFDVNGAELEGIFSPIKNFSISTIITYQDMKNSSNNYVSGKDADGKPISVPIHGKRPIRLPALYGSLTASYTFHVANAGTLQPNITWSYVGKRYADRANLGVLEAFSEFAAGLRFEAKTGWAMRIQVSNLFNGTGLTEGDPRATQIIANPDAEYSNFRPIMPRSIIASISYSF